MYYKVEQSAIIKSNLTKEKIKKQLIFALQNINSGYILTSTPDNKTFEVIDYLDITIEKEENEENEET